MSKTVIYKFYDNNFIQYFGGTTPKFGYCGKAPASMLICNGNVKTLAQQCGLNSTGDNRFFFANPDGDALFETPTGRE